LAIDPNSALAANNLAAASAAHGGNLDEALALAQKARELAPDLVNAADTLGWIQYKKGLHLAAVPLLEECVRKAPESATYRYHLGMVLVATGQNEKARGGIWRRLCG
jgi:tetratricopeptide (TPR) repeat protein